MTGRGERSVTNIRNGGRVGPEAGDGSEFHFEQVSCKEMVEHPDKHN